MDRIMVHEAGIPKGTVKVPIFTMCTARKETPSAEKSSRYCLVNTAWTGTSPPKSPRISVISMVNTSPLTV